MIKTNAMRIVETAGINYKVYEYNIKEAVDAVTVASYVKKPVEQVFKTLVTEAPDNQHGFNHFVFVIPANKELSVKKAAHAAGVKDLSMLPLKKLLPLTGYVHGGCSPVGMKKNFPVFIDETAVLFDTICLSGGKIGLTLELNAEALAAAIHAGFADLTLD
ncbi:MAG: Cys-tRNA(Pro) deacylase [Alphaproteobacteria bacterium]|nr:Cys-tRNA(Pro) deacylase [Alphaproteobacteria bacterium]